MRVFVDGIAARFPLTVFLAKFAVLGAAMFSMFISLSYFLAFLLERMWPGISDAPWCVFPLMLFSMLFCTLIVELSVSRWQ